MSETKCIQLRQAPGGVALVAIRHADGLAADVEVQGRAADRESVQLQAQQPKMDPIRNVEVCELGFGRFEPVEYLAESGEATGSVGFGHFIQVGRDAAEEERMGFLFDPHRQPRATPAEVDHGLALAVFLDAPLGPRHFGVSGRTTQIQPSSSLAR